MIEKHGLTQAETAKKLGVTQPAISQYLHEERGAKIEILQDSHEIPPIIDDMARKIVESNASTPAVLDEFCDICKIIRSKELICQLHKVSVPPLNQSICKICIE